MEQSYLLTVVWYVNHVMSKDDAGGRVKDFNPIKIQCQAVIIRCCIKKVETATDRWSATGPQKEIIHFPPQPPLSIF